MHQQGEEVNKNDVCASDMAKIGMSISKSGIDCIQALRKSYSILRE